MRFAGKGRLQRKLSASFGSIATSATRTRSPSVVLASSACIGRTTVGAPFPKKKQLRSVKQDGTGGENEGGPERFTAFTSVSDPLSLQLICMLAEGLLLGFGVANPSHKPSQAVLPE